ncbi:MAG: protein phosphatase 2C domain-containing protein [Sulfuritalea sp.]|jgi:serine/threonine protein phosphatase PrpC|nr:protein phosphatase 2C domain-containing protein [Sulfuritalea sp.]
MNYTIAQDSRIGGRAINQDRVAWLATDDAVLMVVADGMGGHLQGEVAAQMAVDTVTERFRAEAQPRLADPADFLVATLRQAHETIVRYAAECRIPPHAAPRTTCIACVVQDGQASWAHAGDSRLYLIHNQPQGPARVAHTRDHSIVQRMIDEGSLSHAEAASHPMRHRVFSCLGGDVTPHIDVSRTVPLRDGDLIALCTDGAWAPLGEALVSELGRAPVNTTVPHLLDAAERAAGPTADNLTLIAMRWQAPVAVAEPPPPQSFCDTFIGESPLTDMEIERAIAEIRRRLPQTPNGA